MATKSSFARLAAEKKKRDEERDKLLERIRPKIQKVEALVRKAKARKPNRSPDSASKDEKMSLAKLKQLAVKNPSKAPDAPGDNVGVPVKGAPKSTGLSLEDLRKLASEKEEK